MNKEMHIDVKDLTMAYGDFLIQEKINFTINKGDVFVIMGGSGCGKSTLLRHMVGLKRPAKGDITYKGESFWQSDQAVQDRIRHSWGVLFQSGALFSSMTLAENVSLPIKNYTDYSDDAIRDIVSFKLSLVGLKGFENFYPSEISGGMQKRAGLARAMALDPDILFFDEPSAGLDPVSAKRLDDLIIELSQSLRTTIVIVTHELASIFDVGTNSVFLDPVSKTMLASGDPKSLLENCRNPVVQEFLTRAKQEECNK